MNRRGLGSLHAARSPHTRHTAVVVLSLSLFAFCVSLLAGAGQDKSCVSPTGASFMVETKTAEMRGTFSAPVPGAGLYCNDSLSIACNLYTGKLDLLLVRYSFLGRPPCMPRVLIVSVAACFRSMRHVEQVFSTLDAHESNNLRRCVTCFSAILRQFFFLFS